MANFNIPYKTEREGQMEFFDNYGIPYSDVLDLEGNVLRHTVGSTQNIRIPTVRGKKPRYRTGCSPRW